MYGGVCMWAYGCTNIADASPSSLLSSLHVGDSFYFDVRSRSDFFFSPSPLGVVAPQKSPSTFTWRSSPRSCREPTVDSFETGTNLRGAMGGSSLSTSGECDTERRGTRCVRFLSLPSSISIRSREFLRFFRVFLSVRNYWRCAKPRNRIAARISRTIALVVEFRVTERLDFPGMVFWISSEATRNACHVVYYGV